MVSGGGLGLRHAALGLVHAPSLHSHRMAVSGCRGRGSVAGCLPPAWRHIARPPARTHARASSTLSPPSGLPSLPPSLPPGKFLEDVRCDPSAAQRAYTEAARNGGGDGLLSLDLQVVAVDLAKWMRDRGDKARGLSSLLRSPFALER
jgi:hypothetical protein